MTLSVATREIAKARRERFQRQFAAQIKLYGLPPPVLEYEFALELGRRWRADFAWPHKHLLVEINGAVWRGGAHSHPSGILRDWGKLNDAAKLKYRVLQFTTDEVSNGNAVRFLSEVL